MAFKFIVPLCALLALATAGNIGLAPVAYATAPVVAKIATPSIDAVGTTHQNVVRSFGGTVSTYSKAVDTPYSSVRKEDTRITNNVYTPAVAKTVAYAAPAVTYTAPVVTKTLVAPVPTVAAYAAAVPAPVVYSHAAPAAVVKHAIAYSPAETVAHVSFDGFGAHWAY
ncbi:cuticle protein 67-like [Teleopsis dalmanni]|uniref:cuticle protein 67-like n=1 Tax=Teleopsis dalmanni TaxID=139649 RepID=UPI0018CC7C94|nr:cuticle protein 67-like [Teleopsis dalmanni]